MTEKDEGFLTGIIELLGPEKAGDLFMGEPARDRDAWALLDYLRGYPYETILEDEDEECYVLVMRILRRYIYVLLKNHEESNGYLIQAVTATDYKIAADLALKEYNKCLGKNNP